MIIRWIYSFNFLCST